MDTSVTIPDDFSLVFTLQPNVNKTLEMHVAVWSNKTLTPGTRFRPDDGRETLEKIDALPELDADDIRRYYGCRDTLTSHEQGEIRHCNWVRFLKLSDVIDDVNIIFLKTKDEAIFQVVKHVAPNDEIVAYLSRADDDTNIEQLLKHTETIPQVNVKAEMKQVSPVPFPGIREMMTSPPSREDDCKSGVSDVTPSEDGISPAQNSTCTPETERYSDPDLSPFHANGYPQQLMPLDLTLHKTPPKPSTCSPVQTFTSPVTSHLPSPMTSSSSLSSPPSSSEIQVRPKRNRERTWLPCEVCGKKFDRPSLLKRHMRTHTGEKPHACDVCDKAFSTSSSLNTHRRIHSGEKPHQCGVCGKRFTASSNLYYHKMTHNKDKPHKCNLCSKSFPTPGDLRSHMYVHNGSWPYRCDVCNRGFSKQTNLKNHLLLHTGDKPHECPTCQKKFALYCNLKTHLKTHEDDTQGSCSTCGRTFLKKGDATSDRCVDCLRSPSPMSPTQHRHLSDFSISKLTNSDSKGSFCKPHPVPPTMAAKDEYQSKMLTFYNPLMFMSSQTPRGPYFATPHIPIGYLPVYGGMGGVGSQDPMAPNPAGSLLQRFTPGMSLTDSYRLHSTMAGLKSDWTSSLIAK